MDNNNNSEVITSISITMISRTISLSIALSFTHLRHWKYHLVRAEEEQLELVLEQPSLLLFPLHHCHCHYHYHDGYLDYLDKGREEYCHEEWIQQPSEWTSFEDQISQEYR